ncbi:MAG: hypothetical protein RBU21_08535 [FCB group bacterium]|nr:hypothetical protein [FCB group bacterium]
MWVTQAHMGMTGHCRRCGQTIPVTPENTAEAPQTAADTPERAQRHAQTLLEQALRLIRAQQYEKALQILAAVLSLDDASAEAWYWRGYSLSKVGAYADACDALKRASGLGRGDVTQLLARVEALREWESGPEVLLNVPVYRQAKPRAEARQYRVRLFNTPPEVLQAAGDPVAAAEARYIQDLYNNVRAGTPALVGVDGEMDEASRMLAARKFAAAIPLLEACAAGYRNIGHACAWDCADAVWNLGYAMARSGRVAEGLDCLQTAAAMLAKQGRMKCWVRCVITTLTHRKEPSILEFPSAETDLLVQVCKQLGLRSELLWIHILMVRALLERGRLREAQRIWTLVRPLALQTGGTASEEHIRLRMKLTPEACLRAVVYRLTETSPKGVVSARRALLEWDRQEKPPEQCLEALRAIQLAESLGYEEADLKKMAAELCCELAIHAYAANDCARGHAWWRAALDRDPDIQLHAHGLTRRPLTRTRRQGLTRLLDERVRQEATPEAQAALAGLLVVHALESLEHGHEDKASSSLKIAVTLGLRQEDLRRQIQALGLADAQWGRLGPSAGLAWTAALVSAVEKNVALEQSAPVEPQGNTWLGSGI